MVLCFSLITTLVFRPLAFKVSCNPLLNEVPRKQYVNPNIVGKIKAELTSVRDLKYVVSWSPAIKDVSEKNEVDRKLYLYPVLNEVRKKIKTTS